MARNNPLPVTTAPAFEHTLRRYVRVATVVMAFMLLDEVLARVLETADIRFPSSVAGMLLLFFGLSALHRLRPTAADRLYTLAEPGVRFLGRWMALFFVPPLVVLPVAALPGSGDLWKLGVIMMAGFVFTLTTTAWMVKALSGRKIDVPPEALPEPDRNGPPKRLLLFWVGTALISALAWTHLSGTIWAVCFFLSITVVGFLLGLFLQHRAVSKGPLLLITSRLLHPVVLSAVLAAATIEATGYSYASYLRPDVNAYGPGNLLMALLNPAVIALGFLLYRERMLLIRFAREILVSIGVAALLSLFTATFAARLLAVSTPYALAVIPRSVTTPIAIPIAEIFGANPGITAAFVVLTGVLGAIFGQMLLDFISKENPVVRGAAMGAASHGIGTAALVSTEPASAAVSGVAFALMGAISSLAVSIPPVFEALIRIVS